MTDLLGFEPARRVIQLGRGAFFTRADKNVPIRDVEQLRRDDLVPQLGFVGADYSATRVLLVGINPGNGGNNRGDDAIMMPVPRRLAEHPTEETFRAASVAYQAGFQGWAPNRLHSRQLFGPGRLAYDEVAYVCALPWRTQTEPPFSADVVRKAATSPRLR
jgi:hypothetical protein